MGWTFRGTTICTMALVLLGCGKDAGGEGAACYPNETCDDGLVCRSGLCVDPGPDPDSGVLGYALAVDTVAPGPARVVSSPAGIDCGSSCLAVFAPDTMVTLTVEDDIPNAFVTWSGDCTGTGLCVVTLDQSRSVTATFVNHTLTVSTEGAGEITSQPPGISCGPTCSALFPGETAVTLMPTPAPGYAFESWSGACSGDAACTVTMAADAWVVARFVQECIDAAEPNDSITESTVTPIPDFGPSWTLSGVTICPNTDVDVFRFRIDVTGKNATVEVTHDSTQALLALDILNSTGVSIRQGALVAGSTTVLRAEIINLPSGVYYARVASTSGSNSYDINIETTGP